jgi:hypothetical protein
MLCVWVSYVDVCVCDSVSLSHSSLCFPLVRVCVCAFVVCDVSVWMYVFCVVDVSI